MPRAPGHGLAFARGEAGAPGKRWSGDGFATGQAGDSGPGNLADAERAPPVMRRPGVTRMDWRGACDQPCTCPQGRQHIMPITRIWPGRSVRLEVPSLRNAALCEVHGSKPRDRPGAEREAKPGKRSSRDAFYRRPGMLRSTRSDRPNLSARILLERVPTAGAIAEVQPGKAR